MHLGSCDSIKRHKLQVQQVGKGTECGVMLTDFTGFQPGDVLQCFSMEMVPSRGASQLVSCLNRQDQDNNEGLWVGSCAC